MSGAKPCRLLASARNDMRDIWLYSAEKWGVAQADSYTSGLERTFQTIATMPEIGRAHLDFEPPVRILASAEHLIVYLDSESEVLVVRVLADRQNWREVLSG